MATHHTLALRGSTVGRLAVTTRLCLQEKLHEGRLSRLRCQPGSQSNQTKTKRADDLLIMFQFQEEIKGKLREEAWLSSFLAGGGAFRGVYAVTGVIYRGLVRGPLRPSRQTRFATLVSSLKTTEEKKNYNMALKTHTNTPNERCHRPTLHVLSFQLATAEGLTTLPVFCSFFFSFFTLNELRS